MRQPDYDLLKSIDTNTSLIPIPIVFSGIICGVAGIFGAYIYLKQFNNNFWFILSVFLGVGLITLAYYAYRIRSDLKQARNFVNNHQELARQHEELVKEKTALEEQNFFKDILIKLVADKLNIPQQQTDELLSVLRRIK